MQHNIPWKHSLKIQLGASIIILFSLLAGAIVYTLSSVKARQHDYAILNLAGQLRVITTSIINQSQRYKSNAPRDYEHYYRDVELYNENIHEQIDSYNKIIQAFVKRDLPPSLTGLQQPLTCSWDKRSIAQLNSSATYWDKFTTGYKNALGEDTAKPRLEYGAEFIINNSDRLTENADKISIEFRNMMQKKLQDVTLTVQLVLTLAIFFALAMAALIYIKIVKPISQNISGIKAISSGDFGHQIDVNTQNELGILGRAINQMSSSLNAVFTLSQHVNEAQSVDEILKTVFEEFRGLSPINWTGLLRVDTSQTEIILERTYSNLDSNTDQQKSYHFSDSVMQQVIESNEIKIFNNLTDAQTTHPDSVLISDLLSKGLNSALLFPLTTTLKDDILIIFSSVEIDAYRDTKTGMLSFISNQLTHSYEKNIVMENLVISAVEGLAKLAESRDPETGDHLLRMSIYSSIIAKQLANENQYKQLIDDKYIRDILKFAPMHDIGKVGIEDRILLKPGKLTHEERIEMQQHPVIGGNVLRRCEQQMCNVGKSIFSLGIEIADSHHEKYDGSGYPHGLAGDQIPLSARIVAAADVFDALTSKRPYKDAWTIERTLDVMQQDSGKHFDPDVINALLAAMDDIMLIYNKHKHV